MSILNDILDAMDAVETEHYMHTPNRPDIHLSFNGEGYYQFKDTLNIHKYVDLLSPINQFMDYPFSINYNQTELFKIVLN